MNTPFPGYEVPHDTLTQLLDNVGTPNVNRMNPVLIGVQYVLSTNDGRDLYSSTFSNDGAVDLPYSAIIGGASVAIDTNNNTVDLSTVQLIAENLEATVSDALTLNSAGTSGSEFKVRLTTGCFYNSLGDANLATALNGRHVEIGDEIKVVSTSGGAVAYCKVINYLPTPLVAISTLLTSGGASVTPAKTGTYAGTTDTTFITKIISNDSDLFPTAPNLASVTAANVTQSQLTEYVAYLTAVDALLISNGITHASYAEGMPTACTGTPNVTGLSAPAWALIAGQTAAAVVLKIVTATVYDKVGLHATRTIKWASDVTSKAILLEDQPSTATGLYISLTQQACVAGWTYTVVVSGSGVSSNEYNGLVLSTPAYPLGNTGGLTGLIIARVSGVLTADNTASKVGPVAVPTTTKVTYNGSTMGVFTNDSFYPFNDGRGKIKVAFRAAVKISATEAPILVSYGDDLSQFGEYHDDNDIGYGVRAMQTGAGSASFYVLRTNGDNTADLAAGLQKLRSSDIYYTLALLTDKIDTAQMLRDDITASSSPTSMKWRKGYVGYDSTPAFVLWGELASTGSPRTATLFHEKLTVSTGISRSEGDLISANVRIGDLVRFSGLTVDYQVTSILPGDNGESWELMVSGASADITDADAFTITKPDSANNIADYMIDLAGKIGNPSNGTSSDGRMTLLWGDKLQSAMVDSAILPCKYLAAWIAGLRGSLYPQQGTATYDVTIALSAPTMHTKFTPSVLNRMAACGVMVVTQDSSDSPVYILDQVTTCTTGGLLKFQDNMHHIIDAFSYAIKDGQVGLKGRKNATRVTAAAVANISLRTAIDFCQVQLSEYKIAGPRVIAFYDENGVENQVTVKRSPNLVNRLATYIQIDVPVPLNGIDNVVRASVGTTF